MKRSRPRRPGPPLRGMIPVVLSALAAVVATTWSPAPAAADEPITLIIETAGRGPFSDDDGTVFEDDIVALWGAGIADGCRVGSFCPDDPLTRAQMATMLRRSRPDLLSPTPSPFQDTAGSVFATDIGAIATAGITRGCAPDLFCPDDSVTRETMAAFLRRTFGDRLDSDPDPAPFFDLNGSEFTGDIAWLAGTGITAGCTPERYCPDEVVTRGQMAAFLRRALDLPDVEAPSTILIDLATPTGPGAEGWRRLVGHFFDATDIERALAVIACESKGDPLAKNPNSSASGLFQHLASAWAPRAEAAGYPGASVFDPVANVAGAAWLVYEGGGWSHWGASRGCWS